MYIYFPNICISPNQKFHMMKKIIHILVAGSLLLPVSTNAQSLSDVLGALFGAVTESVSGTASDSESDPSQQNLAQWGISPANYSGITPIGNGLYAVVSDKGETDGFHVWEIVQNPETGLIESVENKGFFGNKVSASASRDCEGIVYFSKTDCVFISGEGDQRVIEYGMDGQRTGRELEIPSQFRSTVSNQGLEALGFGGRGLRARFWATTETTLPADGSPAGPKAPGTQNLLRLQSFKTNLKPSYQFAYKMDAGRSSDFGSTYVFGVPEVCSLPDGRVLVLEREANVPKIYIGADVTCKLYSVKPRRSDRITESTVLSDLAEKDFLEKELVTSWTTRLSIPDINWANYEGMCLGAKLKNGSQTLILVSDSQGGYGKAGVKLQDYIKVIIL